MPDNPDYSKYLGTSVRFSLQDMGELAARLGSISKYDRRGEIIHADDFRHGQGIWQSTLNGAGSLIALTALPNYYSPYCMKFSPSSVASSYAGVSAFFGGTFDGKIGIESGFIIEDNTDQLNINIALYTGAVLCQPRLQWDFGTGEVRIYDNTGSYVVIDDRVWGSGSSNVFYPVKFVFDPSTLKYVRLRISNVEYDISGYSFFSGVSTNTLLFTLTVRHDYVSKAALVAYNSYNILTCNEP